MWIISISLESRALLPGFSEAIMMRKGIEHAAVLGSIAFRQIFFPGYMIE
jgi:hypothetical protein